MFDLNTDEIRRNLAETIAWCAGQRITATVQETPELIWRRGLLQQATSLMNQASADRGRFLNRLLRRDHYKSREWKRGEELMRQADPLSIAPLLQQLRGADLKPSHSLGETQADMDRQALVHSVIVRRSEPLRTREQTTLASVAGNLQAGRLLLYVPVENLADGAAQYASKGFFDIENTPPWEIWVAYSDGTLLSWVPPQLVGLAQSGIDVNPEQCIRWRD
jgi:hypothetical protein